MALLAWVNVHHDINVRGGKLTLSSPRPKKKKKSTKRVGKTDKGFVRNPDRCLSARFDTCFFELAAVRDSKVTLGDNYSCPYSKVTAILIKVSTLRGWNGEPIGSHFLRHEDGNIDSRRAVFCQRNRDAIGWRLVRFVQRKSNVNCHRSILPRG